VEKVNVLFKEVDEKDQRVMNVEMGVGASKTAAYLIVSTKPHKLRPRR
jgi:hypothetical protein